MRKIAKLLVWTMPLSAGAAAVTGGCGLTVEAVYKPLTEQTSTGGGGEGGLPSDCAGDPTTDNAIVRDDCGVFVSATGDDTNGKGTRAEPFKTFAKAASTNKSRVFACAGDYTETAGATFTNGIEIFGGFTTCNANEWTWDDTQRASVTFTPDENAPAEKDDVIGLIFDGGTSLVRNMNVTSASAVRDGGSSIGILVNEGELTLKNVDATAGDGKDGRPGDPPEDTAPLNGIPGTGGVDMCAAGADNIGPGGPEKTCPDGTTMSGGKGGDGGLLSGMMKLDAGNGEDADPTGAGDPPDGTGGLGETASKACEAGKNGTPGVTGSAAVAQTTSPGTISISGFAGANGAAGEDGTNGTPGGGGGGARGGTMIVCNMVTGNRVGASGGSGGTGGCGGKGGVGGGAGGSSLSIASISATVQLDAVRLNTGAAGNGGAGADAQAGGQIGLGGALALGSGSALPSCGGGIGGAGGSGGIGAGGQGGHSVGIAYVGSAPQGLPEVSFGTAGTGGVGGGATPPDTAKGADGQAGETLEL